MKALTKQQITISDYSPQDVSDAVTELTTALEATDVKNFSIHAVIHSGDETDNTIQSFHIESHATNLTTEVYGFTGSANEVNQLLNDGTDLLSEFRVLMAELNSDLGEETNDEV